eukprot:SAG31_NODE_10660_length_1113_cov_1.092702_1_plen_114_part_10
MVCSGLLCGGLLALCQLVAVSAAGGGEVAEVAPVPVDVSFVAAASSPECPRRHTVIAAATNSTTIHSGCAAATALAQQRGEGRTYSGNCSYRCADIYAALAFANQLSLNRTSGT